jgi:hypothetical protein
MSVIDTVDVPDEIAEYGATAVERYLEWCHKNDGEPVGEFQKDLAVMFARQRAHGLKGTDTQNFRGVASGNPFPNMPESLRQHYIKQCKAQGISFSGKVYKSGLVRKGFGGLRMDPEALVDSTADVRKLVESRGWTCEGMVNVKGPSFDDYDDSKPYSVAENILDEHVADEVIEKHGGRIKKKDYADLRLKIKRKLEGGMNG